MKGGKNIFLKKIYFSVVCTSILGLDYYIEQYNNLLAEINHLPIKKIATNFYGIDKKNLIKIFEINNKYLEFDDFNAKNNKNIFSIIILNKKGEKQNGISVQLSQL